MVSNKFDRTNASANMLTDVLVGHDIIKIINVSAGCPTRSI